MRRRHFTLIELAISLLLLALLLATLFGWYHHLTMEKKLRSDWRGPLLEEHFAYQRLQKVLPHANLKPYFFSTDKGELVFTFDRGASHFPLLSNDVLGKLYHDPEAQTLSLGIWPIDFSKKEPSCTQVLLEGVEKVDFQYYFPPNDAIVDPGKVGSEFPTSGWSSSWKHDYHSLPTFVKIKITRKGEGNHRPYCFELVFDLPLSTTHRVTYKK